MKSEALAKLKKEMTYLGILFLVIFAVFKVLFYKEDFLPTLRVVFGLFWLFLVPGFSLLYYWHEKLRFIERIILSFPLSAALVGILSYHLGLIGIDIRYHSLLPLVFLAAGLMIVITKIKKAKKE